MTRLRFSCRWWGPDEGTFADDAAAVDAAAVDAGVSNGQDLQLTICMTPSLRLCTFLRTFRVLQSRHQLWFASIQNTTPSRNFCGRTQKKNMEFSNNVRVAVEGCVCYVRFDDFDTN